MQQVEKFNRQKIRRKILPNFLSMYVCELNGTQDSVTRKREIYEKNVILHFLRFTDFTQHTLDLVNPRTEINRRVKYVILNSL